MTIIFPTQEIFTSYIPVSHIAEQHLLATELNWKPFLGVRLQCNPNAKTYPSTLAPPSKEPTLTLIREFINCEPKPFLKAQAMNRGALTMP